MRFRKDEFYTPINEAYAELMRRRSDMGLLRSIADFFNNIFPLGMGEDPRLVFCRSIASPNFELQYFLSTFGQWKLKPLVYEYHDSFVAMNPMKYHLCKLFFYEHSKRSAFFLKHTLRIVNFNTEEGKNLQSITTIRDEPLIHFHHNLLKDSFYGNNLDIQNFTSWFNSMREASINYYVKFLSLFIAHGILIEDYLFEDKKEAAMIHTRLIPSFINVCKIFGLKPMICRLLPSESVQNPIWYGYPSHYLQNPLFQKYKK